MNGSQTSVLDIVLSSLAAVVIVVGLILWARRVHDKKTLYIRLAITLPMSVLMFFVIFPMMRTTGINQIAGIFFTLAWGWCMAIVWVPAMTGSLGKLFGNFYDGGSAEVDPKPFYSVFRTHRAKGKYQEALAEVRRQLDRFPTDFEGLMFLAELQAENLNDLPGAEITIHRFCQQPGHSPVNIAYALNRLADLHLNLHKDRDAAQRDLEKIIELLPDTEMSLQASQRIGHLADTAFLLEAHERPKIQVKKGVENLGLMREGGRLKPPEINQEQVAADYVEHLKRHPLDTQVREKLAVIYAGHYHRLDLAEDQLQQLIQQPNHPPKQVVHWLNLLADLQVQEGADLGRATETLQRIVDNYPDVAAAETARRRLDTLKLEIRGRQKNSSVQLGTYEQNIGLKKSA
jgi:tetratricopeptide (TPR) repeat protein